MFWCFFVFFCDFLYKSICCGYSFELHRQVDAIQMGTHNICLYKEADKKYTGCNVKTKELLDCVLIVACVVIRSNKVCVHNGNCVLRLFQQYFGCSEPCPAEPGYTLPLQTV